VRFAAAEQGGGALSALQFRGRYSLGSDPIGPEPIDPTAPTGPAVTPPLYVYDPGTQTTSPFLAPSWCTRPPVGVPSTDPVVWLAPPPPTTFFQSVATDIYSNPWW
jgi:hypothetical protein